MWIVDGILKAQPQLVAGLPSQVIAPAAASSPGWVQAVVTAGSGAWTFHPVQAAAAAVWVEGGLGLWMLTASGTGRWSRLAGLGGAAWGLIVWVFGEAFGEIFAPGLSWLSGAPGAAFLYVAAGALLALPASAWAGPRPGRVLLAGTGAFWLVMAVVQALPGSGFWHGGTGGGLPGMVADLADLPQPQVQGALISAFASLVSAHAVAVNLVAVLGLALCGLGLLLSLGETIGVSPRTPRGVPDGKAKISGTRERLVPLRVAVLSAIAFSLVVWVLVQDLGVPGGMGTDPNSMIPWALLLWTGYRAVSAPREDPAVAAEAVPAEAVSPQTVPSPGYGRRAASAGAFGVLVVGVVPMAAAAVSPHADPIIARSIAGPPAMVNRPAPDFQLVSQSGQPVTLASLRGSVTLLTFLDPECTVDCPVATELREAGALLGANAGQVRLVAIAANPRHFGPDYTRALIRRDGLDAVPNWLFLTGDRERLQQAWGHYGIYVSHMASGSAVMSDKVFVIDKACRIRQEITDNPGPGTSSTRSSFAVLLSDAARQVLAG